jgi:hypothetical protein
MSDDIPVITGKPLAAEDKRLLALLDRLEEGQIEFLDQAAKRIIELSSAMLAILFAVMAFGKDFPPSYLKADPVARGLALAALLIFVLALLAGVIAVQPQRYAPYRYDLADLRRAWEGMIDFKLRWFRVSSFLFFAGALALAALAAVIVWRA